VMYTKQITDELSLGIEVPIKGILLLTTLELFRVISIVDTINSTSDLSLR